MQKKIVALAVAGLSTAAFAQTNVTIYGVADVSGQGFNQSNVKNGANGVDGGNLFAVQSNSSLIGFKGTEDLGNGLKALFQAETELNLAGNRNTDNGARTNTGVGYGSTTSVFTNLRDSYVGVSSKYGSGMAGYLSTPLRATLTSFDVMPGATGSSQIDKQMAAMRIGGADYSTSIRATGIAYALPTMYGFNGSIAYTGSNNNGGSNATNPTSCSTAVSACSIAPQSAFGFNLGWTGYGVNVQGAFQQNNNSVTPNYATGSISGNTVNGLSAPTSGQFGNFTSYLIGAAYTGVPGLKLSTAYIRNTLGTNGTASLPNTGAATIAADGTVTYASKTGANVTQGAGKVTNNQLFAGASYRMGNWEPRISATWSSDVNGSNYQQLGSRQWTANVGYFLSKRTQVYGLVSNLNNSANQNYTFGQQTNGMGTTGLGSNLFTYGAGMRTTF